jgi:hypothetical protein
VSHGWSGLYHGAAYGALTVLVLGMLWRWRQWYVTAADGARAARSCFLAVGGVLVFSALWLTCGRVSLDLDGLAWAIPPVALLGAGAVAAGLGRLA